MFYMQHTPSNNTPCETPFQEHMYDGCVDVIQTVCEIPNDKPHWRERLLGLGFSDISYEVFCKYRGIKVAQEPSLQKPSTGPPPLPRARISRSPNTSVVTTQA